MGVFDFFKKTAVGKDGEVTKSEGGPVARLFEEEALDHLVQLLTKVPDPDEVLKKAGVPRHRLSVLLYDDEIGQACETRLDALLTVPHHIYVAEGEGTDRSVDLETLLAPHLQNIQAGAWQARLFGYSVQEAVYQLREDGLIGLSFVGEKPMEWFEPKPDGKLMYFPADGSGGSTGIEVDQEYKFLLTRCKPTYKNPYGEALLSRLYWAWYFRTNGWKFWGKFLERFGTPLLVGKSSDPVKMVNALLMAHSNAVIGVGREDDVSAVGVPSGNSGQTFEIFEAAAIRRIQKVVLGQTLSSGTDGGSGNRALGQVHDAVRMDKRDSDITLTQETVQHAIDALCKLNGWGRHLVEFADGKGLEKDRSERDKNLYAVGVRFTEAYITDNYDLNAEDFTLTSGAAVTDAGATPTQSTPSNAKQQGSYPAVAGGASVSFSKGKRRFTKHQQQVEDLATDALSGEPQPIDPAQIRKAVLAATSPEDLSERLFALLGDTVADEQFQATLEQALFAADVLGYVAAEEQSA
jgi:phage gp29-like protein